MVSCLVSLIVTFVCAVVVQGIILALVKEQDIQSKNKWARISSWGLWSMVIVNLINFIIHLV